MSCRSVCVRVCAMMIVCVGVFEVGMCCGVSAGKAACRWKTRGYVGGIGHNRSSCAYVYVTSREQRQTAVVACWTMVPR